MHLNICLCRAEEYRYLVNTIYIYVVCCFHSDRHVAEVSFISSPMKHVI